MVTEVALGVLMVWLGTTPARGLALAAGALGVLSLLLGHRWWAIVASLVVGWVVKVFREA